MGELYASVIQYPEDFLVGRDFRPVLANIPERQNLIERLTPEFFRLVAREDMSHFIMLRIPETGKLIAFMLCFHVGTRVIDKYIGIDYKVARDWYLYFRL
jgi:hypothetical protein